MVLRLAAKRAAHAKVKCVYLHCSFVTAVAIFPVRQLRWPALVSQAAQPLLETGEVATA